MRPESADFHRNPSHRIHAVVREMVAAVEITEDSATSVGCDATPRIMQPEAESQRLLHNALLDITGRLQADAGQFVTYDPATGLLLSCALSEGGRIIPHPADFLTRIRATGPVFFDMLQGGREPRSFDAILEPGSFWPGTLEFHRHFGTRTLLVVPLHFAERFVGYLALAYRDSRALAPHDQPLVESLSHHAAMAAELVRLSRVEQQALLDRTSALEAQCRAAASERRAFMLNAIAAASRDLQNADDFEKGLRSWLKRVAQAAGADAAGLGEYHFLEAEQRVIPAIRAIWSGAFDAEVKPGSEGVNQVPETLDFNEWTAKILAGETVWANFSDLKDPASRRYWEADRCAGHVLVPVDLAAQGKGFMSFDFFTERPYDGDLEIAIQTAAEGLGAAVRRHAIHRAQIAERDDYAARIVKSNAALQATVDAVSNLEKIDTFLPRVLGIVASAFDAIGAGYFEHDDTTIWHRFWLDDGKILAATELPNLDPQHIPTMQLLADGFWCPPEHLGVDIRERTRPSIVHHSTATASPRLHAFCVSRGWHWELNVPLFVGGRTDAAIVLYHDEERPFTGSDVEFAESLAKQISLAREVGRLSEVERKAAILVERERAGLARAALLERSNMALQESVDLFSRIGRMAEAVPGVLRIVAAAFSADYCAYCEYSDATIYVRHWYWNGQVLGTFEPPGLEPAHAEFVRRLAGGFAAQGNRLAIDALERNRPYVVDHRVSVGEADVQRFRSDLGWDLELNIPLVVGDRNVGGLMIFRSAPDCFSDDEIALGASLGKQLALAMQVTVQAEREREMALARERAVELARANAVMRQVNDLMASERSPEGVINHVLRELAALVGADAAALYRYDEPARQVRFVVGYERGRLTQCLVGHPYGHRERPGSVDDVPGWETLIEERRPLFLRIPPDQATPPGNDYHRANDHRMLALSALVVADRPIGMLAVAFRDDQPLSASRLESFSALAQQTTLALQLADLAEQASAAAVSREREGIATARAQELERASNALQQTVDAVSGLESLEAFIPQALRIAAKAFGAGSAGFFEIIGATVFLRFWLLGDRVYGPPELAAAADLDLAPLSRMAAGFAVPEDYLGVEPMVRRQAVRSDSRGKGPVPEFDTFARSMGWQYALHVPLLAENHALGAITLYRSETAEFTDSDLTLAESLAKHVALALQVARIAERDREIAVTRERAAELSKANVALRESLDSLASAPNLDEFLGHVLRVAAKQAGVELAHLWVHDAEGWVSLRLGYCHGEVFGPEAFHRMPLAQTYMNPFQVPPGMIAGEAIGERTKHFVQDLFTSPYVAELIGEDILAVYRGLGVRHEINVPLRFSGRCIAHLAVYLPPDREVREELIELVAALGNQAMLAMEMTRLARAAQESAISREREQAARSRADDLEKANRVLKQTLDFTSSEPNLGRVLGQVLRAISQQLQSEASAIWLLDEKSKRFKPHLLWEAGRIIEVNSDSASPTHGTSARGRDLILKTHIHERRPILYDVAAFRDGNRTAHEYFTALGVVTVLGVPLLMGDDIVGSLTVRFSTTRSLTEEDLTLTQAMAHQATMAIQLTRLAKQASVAAVAEERTRFARDVHDTLAQGFTGILMQLGAASQVSGKDRDGIAPHLAAIGSLARSSLAEARRSVRELRRMSALDRRLEERFEQLVERMRLRTSAAIHLQMDGMASRPSARAQTELLGIAQEAIVNAIKHSGCTTILVCCECASSEVIRISVKDDGVGFDSTQPTTGESFGILGMQERAVLIGASLTIVSERSRGTEIVVQYRTTEHAG